MFYEYRENRKLKTALWLNPKYTPVSTLWGVGRKHWVSLYIPTNFLKDGRCHSTSAISSWKPRGTCQYLLWSGLLHLPQFFLMSAREGNSNFFQIPTEVTSEGRASSWEKKGREWLLGRFGIMCGTTLIFILCWDHSEFLICEVTVALSGPPDCACLLWTSF